MAGYRWTRSCRDPWTIPTWVNFRQWWSTWLYTLRYFERCCFCFRLLASQQTGFQPPKHQTHGLFNQVVKTARSWNSSLETKKSEKTHLSLQSIVAKKVAWTVSDLRVNIEKIRGLQDYIRKLNGTPSSEMQWKTTEQHLILRPSRVSPSPCSLQWL